MLDFRTKEDSLTTKPLSTKPIVITEGQKEDMKRLIRSRIIDLQVLESQVNNPSHWGSGVSFRLKQAKWELEKALEEIR